MFDALATRFKAMPRAMRWLLIAVALTVGFLAWDTTIGATVARWNQESDTIEAQVRTVTDTGDLRDRLRRMDETVIGIGPVADPGRENAGRSDLTNAVVEVLGGRVKYSFELGGGGEKLREDVSRRIVGPGSRLSRLTGTLKFDASPDRAIEIISELESREDIQAIRKVTITKSDSRGNAQVTVSLTLETWVEVSSARRRI